MALGLSRAKSNPPLLSVFVTSNILPKACAMHPIEAAILRTILYADVFNFPMTTAEIHQYLIHSERVSLAQIEHALSTSTRLRRLLKTRSGYITLVERQMLIDVRIERERASAHLWPAALRCGTWLARLPYVRMVAVTGALAVRNAAHAADDLDYLVVTAANRVWLGRALAIGLVRLARLRGLTICPNYVLSENAFEQNSQDLFIAHEIAQMVPIYGNRLYEQFRAANPWVMQHLPNAESRAQDEPPLGQAWVILKRILEALFGGAVGNALDNWEYRRKLRRFATDLRTPHSAARLDRNQVKGHFNDYGFFVLSQYHARLQQYGLLEETEALRATGD